MRKRNPSFKKCGHRLREGHLASLGQSKDRNAGLSTLVQYSSCGTTWKNGKEVNSLNFMTVNYVQKCM